MGRSSSDLASAAPMGPRPPGCIARYAASFLGCLGVAVFVVTRAVLHGGLPPFFVGDSYKYLGGADSLRAGLGLPPIFGDLVVTGGALHAVPGYAWLILATWGMAGGISLAAVPWVNSIVALAGYLAAADLVRRLGGALAGAMFFLLLAASPALGWLEHLLMPDVLAAPLFFVEAWILVAAFRHVERPLPAFALGGVCGALAACLLMLRVSNQAFLLPLLLLALLGNPGPRALAAWTAGSVLAAALGLSPWISHNLALHGVAKLSASQGRHLRFSQLWTDAEERQRVAAAQGTPANTSPDKVSLMVDNDLRALVAKGLSVAEADAELGRRAWARYGEEPWSRILGQRIGLLRQFFVEEPGTASRVQSPATHFSEILANDYAARRWREWTAVQQGPRYSADFTAAHDALGEGSPEARWVVAAWMRWMTLDGLPLLVGYGAGLVLLAWLGRRDPTAFLVFGAFPLLWFAMTAMVGLPRYRYQVALHPFELATIVLGVAALAGRLRRGRKAQPC